MENIEFRRGVISAGDCVSQGWELIKNNYGMFLGIGLVALILAGCIPCVSLFLSGPILCGVYYVYLREINGEPADFGMMFKGFENFVPAMVIGIIAAIPEIIGQGIRFSINIADLGIKSNGNGQDNIYNALGTGMIIGLSLLGLVIFVLAIALKISMFFVFQLIAEHKLGAMDAIKLSSSAAWGNLGGIIVLFLLEALIMIGGFLLLCFGMFLISIPLIYAANAYAYRQVFPNMQSRFRQTAPPAPNEYGGNYGVGR